VYLYAAVNAATGASSAMLAPTVNTDYMNAHLQFISRQVTPGSHGILVLDQAGWHTAKALQVPENLTLLHLPPYSPELNPVERVWQYLRGNYLSNRVFKDYDHLFDATATAWNRLDQEQLKSICHTEWTERAI
jgi:transposase